MPELFATSFCLSGRCVCRLHMEACLIERELQDQRNHLAEKHKAEELLQDGARLLAEQELHTTFGNGAPCGKA